MTATLRRSTRVTLFEGTCQPTSGGAEAYRGRCEAVKRGREASIYRSEEDVSAQATAERELVHELTTLKLTRQLELDAIAEA